MSLRRACNGPRITPPRTGNYYLWARVKGGSWTANSFYVAWDASPPFHYEIPQFGGQWAWVWDRVHTVDLPETPYALTAGQHTLFFRGREANAALDALILTDDPSYVPEAQLTPTLTATATRTSAPAARLWLPMIARP